MNKTIGILIAALLLRIAIPSAGAAETVSIDFFYDQLDPYGDWMEVGNYGYCWHPKGVGRNWRPYNDGHWAYTDAGWTWISEEPYGWAVYHYGRWARIEGTGWFWVPGTEWAPAWVSWRRSPRHVGWAPLPPEAEFRRESGFNVSVDSSFDIGPTAYSFVEVRNFGEPRLRSVILEPRENITIINETTNITKTTYVNNVIYNGGPQYDVINRESAQPIRRLKLDRRADASADPRALKADQLAAKVEGDSLRVAAPTFSPNPAAKPKKVAAKIEKVEVNHGWKDAGSPAQVEMLRAKVKTEAANPAEALTQPKATKTAKPTTHASTPSVSPGEQSKKMDDKPVADKPLEPVKKPSMKTKPAKPDTATIPESSPKTTEPVHTPETRATPAKMEKGGKPRKPESKNQPTGNDDPSTAEKGLNNPVKKEKTPDSTGAPQGKKAGEPLKMDSNKTAPTPRLKNKNPHPETQGTEPARQPEKAKGRDKNKKDDKKPDTVPSPQ